MRKKDRNLRTGFRQGISHLTKPLDAEKMIIALKQCMADNSDVKLHEDL